MEIHKFAIYDISGMKNESQGDHKIGWALTSNKWESDKKGERSMVWMGGLSSENGNHRPQCSRLAKQSTNTDNFHLFLKDLTESISTALHVLPTWSDPKSKNIS